MTTRKHKPYVNEVEAIRSRFETELQALGEKVRAEVVEPVCKKHGLRFLSGNGDFFFINGNDTYGQECDMREASAALRKDLLPIFDLLNTVVTHGDYLGYYVSNVEKA